MGKRTVNAIRSAFLDFFVQHGHKLCPSSNLVAEGDATLLFTNAGMVQFKQAFETGKNTFQRAVTSQKCLRAGGKHNDLENVGHTNRHHTFFEMLGNFSFGDYFKDTAIELAWNFVTRELGLSRDRLCVTVYGEDQEAFDIWKKITGFSDSRIIRISTDDNFWSMGNTGPCGPCSEIFYDYGEDIPGGPPGTPEEDGPRFTEIWNLVFMQYNRDDSGAMHILPRKCIDTGMGLERIASVVQGVHDNYDTDMFEAIRQKSVSIFGGNKGDPAHKVIADHVRAVTFLICEGLTPGNEGRNYVLRRIIRRAIRYAYKLNSERFCIHEVVPVLTREGTAGYMGEAYPEIVRAEEAIISTLRLEEEGFSDTLLKGMLLLEKEISALSVGDILRGEIAFKLYDTYGFPLDITMDVARERGLKFDQAGFDSCMTEQKTRSRTNWVGSGESDQHSLWSELAAKHKSAWFVGYERCVTKATVKAIVKDGKEIEVAETGEKVCVLLDVTPFYAESGGQEGDKGVLRVIGPTNGCDTPHQVLVECTKKGAEGIQIHECTVQSGQLRVGDVVEASVDQKRRTSIKANHSVTHILHNVLRRQLGQDVHQKGSLVAEEKLRFDFNYPQSLTKKQIQNLEDEVNAVIMSNKPVFVDHCSYDKAIEKGAIALFGEKYSDDSVRVISMGESRELCCGTHVSSTGEIGAFKIVSEVGIAQGIRRIEAVTGHSAMTYMQQKDEVLTDVADMLGVPVGQILSRLTKLLQEKRELSKKLASAMHLVIKKETTATKLSDDVVLYQGKFTDIPVETVLEYVTAKRSTGSVYVMSTHVDADKVIFVVGVGSQKEETQISAKDIVNVLVRGIDGKGGGSNIMARVSINAADFTRAEEMILAKIKEAI